MKYRNYYVLFLFLFPICFSANAVNPGFGRIEKNAVLPVKNLENSTDVFCLSVSIIGEGIIPLLLQINQCTGFSSCTNKTSEKHFSPGNSSNSIVLSSSNPFFVKDNSFLFLNLKLPFYIAYRKLII